MSKIALIGLLAAVVLLVGASAVLAQDATPGSTIDTPICPSPAGLNAEGKRICQGPGNLTDEQRQQMQDAMQSGDWQQMQNTCQNFRNAQGTST